MAKKQVEEVNFNYQVDDTEPVEELIPLSSGSFDVDTVVEKSTKKQTKGLISCLRNERVIARYINRPNNNIQNPRHELYGGMANTAFIAYTVPMLRSGALVNVLTDSEKAFLEEYMGLDNNALSVYLKTNNYWSNFRVRLNKGDNIFDLSTPEDYIKYKVLLANKDDICPSMTDLSDRKRATYRFVLINEGDEVKDSNTKLNIAMEASMLLGKYMDDKSTLKLIVETITNRSISKKSKLDFIKAQAFECIQSNPKLFVSLAKDKYLKTKVLISECLEYGLIVKRNEYYYLASDRSPLCEANEESTLEVSSAYLNSPKRQEIKLTLEAKLKAVKE